jgi:hypothetical protein
MKDVFAVIGFVAFFGWVGDAAWGVYMAWRGIDPNGIGGIAAAFAYGLFNGGQQ